MSRGRIFEKRRVYFGRSVDMGSGKENSSYCPQSEPVKRKVYAGSASYGRIQKTLGEHHVMLRNSDGDTAADDTGT